MASEALKSAAMAQAAAIEANRGSVSKAVDYLKNKNITAALGKIRAVRSSIADSIRSKEVLKQRAIAARNHLGEGINAGFETAKPTLLALAERRDAIRNHISDVAVSTYENHRVFVGEKFNKVVAPKLLAMSDNTGLSRVNSSTLTETLTDAHKVLSVRVSGKLRGLNIAHHPAAAEAVAFVAVLIPLLAWLAACAYMLYKALGLGCSKIPELVYFGNMFWCAYCLVLFSIVMLLGQVGPSE